MNQELAGDRFTKTRLLILLLGVLLPSTALLVECYTGLARKLLFDPIPSWFHVALFATIPLANLRLIVALGRGEASLPRPWALLHSFSIGIALYYSVLFIPVMPISILLVLMYGFGLLALAPVLSMLCALQGRKHLRQRAEQRGGPPLRRVWPGILLALTTLALPEVPASFTRIGMQMAMTDDERSNPSGMRWLRTFGSEQEMLRLCYARTGHPPDLVSLTFGMYEPIPTERARTIFYRATGKPFNSHPKPQSKGRSVWRAERDNDVGGEVVGMRAAGVELASSRMDGSVDARAALGYLEWTMVFRNNSSSDQEGRAEIVLPPGAVVSRLTLWINGEEREAAFDGRTKVRKAYQAVVQTRRDPVLVTTASKDRILMQLFPIPPNKGEMKVRVGITAPLLMRDLHQASLHLPSFNERNFELARGLKHAVWVDSPSALTGAPSLRASQADGKSHTLRGNLAEPADGQGGAVITAERDPEQNAVWTVDSNAGAGRVVVQTLRTQPATPPRRVALVIDGSYSLNGLQDQLASALAQFPAEIELGIVVAGDGEPEVFTHNAADPERTRAYLRALAFEGGQDNTVAMAAAWDWAALGSGGAMIWLHGPQPLLTPDLEPLLQRYQRRGNQIKLYDLQAVRGTNLIGPKLDDTAAIETVPRSGTVQEDLGRLFAQWRPNATRVTVVRAHANARDVLTAAPTSDHLARLYAAEQVAALLQSPAPEGHALAVVKARKYQLVTSATGAVVLETQAQYDAADLQPVTAGSVPTIPEPETWAMMIVALLVLAWRYRRRRVMPAGMEPAT